MRTLRISVRCDQATGLWTGECPQLPGVRAAHEDIQGVIRAIYSLIPPEWQLQGQRTGIFTR